MPETLTTPADGIAQTPATDTPDAATNPQRVEGSDPAAAPSGTVETATGSPDPAQSEVQNGSGDGTAPKAEPPVMSVRDVQHATHYELFKLHGVPLPQGFTPSKKVLAWFAWKHPAADAGAPGQNPGTGDGAKPSGAASPAPAGDIKDPALRMRAAYATMDPAKVNAVMAADWYLEHQGVAREALVDMPPDARVQLSVTLKKRDGNVARMAGRNGHPSPRQTPPRRPADGSQSATLPANKTAPKPQPNDDVLSDAPEEVRGVLDLLDESQAKAVADYIASKAQPPEPDPTEETEATAPAFDERETRLVQGNVKLLDSVQIKEFPWLAQPGAKEMVAARVKAFAEEAGIWPEILLDYERLSRVYGDQATLVQARDIKGSKTVAAQAAAITAPAVRAPVARAARGTRELSRAETVAIASRAAREANGSATENSRLFAKYMEEARGT